MLDTSPIISIVFPTNKNQFKVFFFLVFCFFIPSPTSSPRTPPIEMSNQKIKRKEGRSEKKSGEKGREGGKRGTHHKQ